MADSFYCLDLGENLMKTIDAKEANDTIEIQNIAHVQSNPLFYTTDLDKEIELQAKIMQKLVDSLKNTKKNVSVVIPDSITYSQIMEMPKLNEKELISAIKYQADQFIPMPIEETNIDLEILSENMTSNTLLVLIVAAPKKMIEKVQKTVELAGLIPNSVENELSATTRMLNKFYAKMYQKAGQYVFIVNLAYNSTSLYCYDTRNNLTVQSHTFNIGYALFAKELQINLNIDVAKAIEILTAYAGQEHISVPVSSILAPILKEFLSEIKRFMAQVADKYKTNITGIHITNNGFRFPYLSLYLKNEVSMTIDVLNPYALCKKSSMVEAEKNALPVYIAAIGGNFR